MNENQHLLELNSLYKNKKYHPLIAYFVEYKTSLRQNAQALHLCGLSFKATGKSHEALKFFETCQRISPNFDGLDEVLGEVYFSIGNIHKAYDAYERILKKDPTNFHARWFGKRLLPYVYKTEREISLWRGKYECAIAELIQTPVSSKEEALQIISGIMLKPNFEITYQGKNDKALQEQWGTFVHKVAAIAFPEYTKAIKPKATSHKKKIAFISENFYSHTIGLLFGNWITKLDKTMFHISTYIPAGKRDRSTEILKAHSDVFKDLRGLSISEQLEEIQKDKPDIIIYPDLGMGVQSFILAACRLAPTQCISWGHPVTSGLPTIDYFITSAAMEVSNYQDHYTEKLVHIPSIGISYNQSPPVHRERELADNRIKYLCCQATQKYLPQYDHLFPQIAVEVKQAEFIFIEHATRSDCNVIFKERLKRAFEDVNLSFSQFVTFIPWQEWRSFLQLCANSDVFLDSIEWSGGNTTLEAISQNLPTITLPCEFMRSRHTTAILNELSLTELIAKNTTEYKNLAVRLGQDHEYRLKIRSQIELNKENLFSNQTTISALSQFLLSNRAMPLTPTHTK